MTSPQDGANRHYHRSPGGGLPFPVDTSYPASSTAGIVAASERACQEASYQRVLRLFPDIAERRDVVDFHTALIALGREMAGLRRELARQRGYSEHLHRQGDTGGDP